MLTSIYLNNLVKNLYHFYDGGQEIKNLSKINILIGPNNSGKSKFLRTLFSAQNFDYKTEDINLEKINDSIKELSLKINNLLQINKVNSIEGVDIKKIQPLPFLSTNFDIDTSSLKYINSLRNITSEVMTLYLQATEIYTNI